jgi:hypothetical protein
MVSFEHLCQGFCTLEGLPMPRLDTGRDGLEAITLDVDGVSLSVLHDALVDPELLFLVAELEAPPPDMERQGWLALLEANYWLRSEHAPAFSRNPESGHVVFQWTLPLADHTAESLHETVTTMTRLARQWHPSASAQQHPQPHHQPAVNFGAFA